MKAIHMFAVLALATLLSLPALARDWYVSAAGTGDGLTAGSPTQDLAAVLNSAVADDALYLNGGDGFGYAPNLLTVAVRLSLQSYGAGQAIISNTSVAGSQLLNITAGGSGSTLNNIQFLFNDMNGYPDPYRTIYLDNNANNVTIKHCGFRHADAPGGAYENNSFIEFNAASAHANVVIANNVFSDLRYENGFKYRHYIIVASGANDMIVANNIVSNYEGFIRFYWDSARVKVLSNKLYRCYGSLNWSSISAETAGGLMKVGWGGLSAGDSEFGWNIIFNGFPDMTNDSQYAAFLLDYPCNDLKVHNNTFYGLGAACLINHGGWVQNMDWYNNILIVCNPANATFGFYSGVADGIWSGTVYSNIWDPFQTFNSPYFSGDNVHLADNPQLDPLFASLDPGSSAFLRPTNTVAAYGLGSYIGAVNPVPEPVFFGCALAIAALTLARKR